MKATNSTQTLRVSLKRKYMSPEPVPSTCPYPPPEPFPSTRRFPPPERLPQPTKKM